ncbi:hypothetical protein [Vibrio sp. 10N.247.311.51]|uniref:hypothetical protein n=1 Tax=Vibrio sp. 10N.247.311.51 TaxID=3229996 RepID=UPI003550D2B0
MNAQGFDSDLIEAALAHEDENKIRKAYNRTDYLDRRPIMQWWSERIERAGEGELLEVGFKSLRVVAA